MANAGLDSIGERLRFLRGLSGLSARALDRLVRDGAESSAYTSLIEAGKRSNINASLASKYAAVLGCSFEWLILGVGRPPSLQSVRRAIGKAAKAA